MGATSTKNCRYFFVDAVYATVSRINCPAGATFSKWNLGKSVDSGFDCIDNFSGRGRKSIEEKLPNLLDDIKDIVEPENQCDPTFRTTQLYSPLTAGEVCRRLIEDKEYSLEQMPTVRTISSKLNQLGYSLKKVAKTEPKKK